MSFSGNNSTSSQFSLFNRYTLSAYVFIPTIIINLAFVIFILSKSQLRVPSNIIICSSCISSLLFGFIIVFTAIVNQISDRSLRITLLTCVVGNPTELTCAGIFNAHIAAISLERFFSVVYPFKYQRYANKKSAVITLFFTWAIPICSIYILITLTSLRQVGHCYGWLTISELYFIFNYVLVPAVLFLPSIITFISYSVILCKIYAMQRKTWSETRNLVLSQPSSTYQLMLQHRKALIQMFMVIGIYAIAFYPFFICYTALLSTRRYVFLIPTYITYLFAIIYLGIHPLLIVYFNTLIKDEAKKCWKNLRLICSKKKSTSSRTTVSQVVMLSHPIHSTVNDKKNDSLPMFHQNFELR
ncbi:Trace amine-associated receptor 1 [Trichoplax sp. H2]|nr:Trace amine-associated receptor 1 [Trichoplax sp. H2]|eukprot:RDD37323.1 Trace amine-associated receptor 1 [Trichoplax sp. H2]